MLPQTRYNSKYLTGHKFESVRTITTELPSMYISVLFIRYEYANIRGFENNAISSDL